MRLELRSALSRGARITAALLGSCVAAVSVAVFMARVCPGSRDARFLTGFLLLVPLWIAGMCWGFLRRSGLSTWGLFLLIAGVTAGASKALPPLGGPGAAGTQSEAP